MAKKIDMIDKRIEILAPAGSFEALKMAIINGADAVYLGLGAFNARAQAQNFTIETLKTAIDYAHIFGVRVYLAINTLIKDSELFDAINLAKQAWDTGVSAIIVQDLGFARALKAKYGQIVLHASTQMGIHNLDGAIVAQKLGLERVILSRETPISEIKNIATNCNIELEYFVHGALCCGFSGNCYFSSLIAGKSGNRGRCLQLCRKPYFSGSNSSYWLSTRDTMLVNHLGELANAGICSFKIEGRMRRPEYVGEVVKIYKKAMQSDVNNDDINALKLMFNRGNFFNAHLFGANCDIIYPKLQSHMGVKLGNVSSVCASKAVLDCEVGKGDGLKFLRQGREVGHALVLNDGFCTGFVGEVKMGDSVHLTDCAKKNKEINSRTKKLPISIEASFFVDKNSCNVAIKSGSKTFKSSYCVDLQIAKNNPLTKHDIKSCLTSLGNTNFECDSFSLSFDREFFAPKAEIRALRRQFICDFEQFLLNDFCIKQADNSKMEDIFTTLAGFDGGESCTIVMCDPDDLLLYQNLADFIAIKPRDYSKMLTKIERGEFVVKENYLLDLPAVSFLSDTQLLKRIIDTAGFKNYIVNNLFGLNLVNNGKILLGYKMNLLNGLIDFPHVCSVEGRLVDKSSKNSFVYIFGNPDLMQTVHCYHKINNGCECCKQNLSFSIVDDKGESYSFIKQKVANCYNFLVFSKPLNVNAKLIKKRFIDAVNLNEEQKRALICFLTNKQDMVVLDKSMSPRLLE